MSEHLEATFNRLKLSERDFSEAHEYLERYPQASEIVMQRALIVSAIVAYSRPFKKNYGSKADADTSLVLPPSFFEEQSDQALHDKVIQLRDEGIAHSDYDRKPTRRVEAQGRGFMTRSKPFDPLAELDDIERFKRIAWRLKFHCVDKMFIIDRQLKGSDDKAVISAKGIELVEGGTTEVSVTFKLNGT